MKSPDEIKKAMSGCHAFDSCSQCPYFSLSATLGCKRRRNADALALIQQLEADNARQHEKIRVLELSQQAINATNIEQEHKIWQLEAERDAAVRDITEIVQEYGEPYCEYCGADFKPKCTGKCWTHNEGFKWRGVQKEE